MTCVHGRLKTDVCCAVHDLPYLKSACAAVPNLATHMHRTLPNGVPRHHDKHTRCHDKLYPQHTHRNQPRQHHDDDLGKDQHKTTASKRLSTKPARQLVRL